MTVSRHFLYRRALAVARHYSKTAFRLGYEQRYRVRNDYGRLRRWVVVSYTPTKFGPRF